MLNAQIVSTTTILQIWFERPNLVDFAYTIWLVWCKTVAYSACEVHICAKSVDWSEKNGVEWALVDMIAIGKQAYEKNELWEIMITTGKQSSSLNHNKTSLINTKHIVQNIADGICSSSSNSSIEHHNCSWIEIFLSWDTGFRNTKKDECQQSHQTSSTEFVILVDCKWAEHQVGQEGEWTKTKERNECDQPILQRTVFRIWWKKSLLHCQLVIRNDVLVFWDDLHHLQILP